MNTSDNTGEDLDADEMDFSDREFQRQRITGELTKLSVALFEHYSDSMGKNTALGLMIESLSETLGNMISLVADEEQQTVIDSANLVIQQGLTSQQENIALLAYGQVGHA